MKFLILLFAVLVSSCSQKDWNMLCRNTVIKEFNTSDIFQIRDNNQYYIVRTSDGGVWYVFVGSSSLGGWSDCNVNSKTQIFPAPTPQTTLIPKTKLVPMT